MDLLFDVGSQRSDGSRDDGVQQPSLSPDKKRRNEIHDQCEQQGTAHRGEVDSSTRYYVHAAEQIGEVVVSASSGLGDSLRFGDPGR